MTAAGALARVIVRPRSARARAGEPLAGGVPFAKGVVTDADALVLRDVAGRACPTAAHVLERWRDGSVRWALLETIADVPAEGTTLELHAAPPPPPPTPVRVRAGSGRIEAACAGFALAVDVAAPHGVTITRDGAPLLDPGRTAWDLRDAQGGAVPVRWEETRVMRSSALAATVAIEGTAAFARGQRLAVSAAFSVYAGRAAAHVEVALHNPQRAQHPGGYWELGDAGSVLLRAASLRSAWAGPPPAGIGVAVDGHEPLRPATLPYRITQVSSGGEAWDSPVHVDALGAVPFNHRGYEVASGGPHEHGLRARPTLAVLDGSGTPVVVLTAPAFWEVFPKAFDVGADGGLEVAWLPPIARAHEIQGGERCRFEFALGFGADDVSDPPLEWRRAPSVMLPDPATAAAAPVVPFLLPAAAANDTLYERLVGAAVDGADTLAAKRERIDEYGWRHFGDLYADHENGADASTRRVSHYNNQYDGVAGLITQALRTGDVRWWELADDLARHVAHVDVYWTDQDKAAYNGGLFWHTLHYLDAGRSTHRAYPRSPGSPGGGPSNEHCYASGLLLHYYLTGAPMSAAAVRRLADWVIAADDGALAPRPLPWLSASATGYASATGSPDYHGPGRGAANAVLTLLAAARLTGRAEYLAKAHDLVARVVHPQDDIDALSLPDTERRWSYTVMLQALGRYHDVLAERGDEDARAQYARATLRHYARWMAAHEFPYLDKPEILEFPTETWAAHDLRKSEVFDLAALHASSPEERSRFVERARFFHRSALETLAELPTSTRTRPLVLLMSNGFARAWHERRGAAQPFDTVPAPSWPARRRFVTQKATAKRRLAWAGLCAAGLAAAGAAWVVL